MDIGSKHGYPASALSNFAPHPFVVTYVGYTLICSSMEGFLQSLKFKNPEMQKHVATLTGYFAKKSGKEKNWKREQVLWWNGEPIGRHTEFYQELLDAAFTSLFENRKFQTALKATNNATLTHSIGKSDSHETVLTRKEFISRLHKLRLRIT
jgi:hypothetical protein